MNNIYCDRDVPENSNVNREKKKNYGKNITQKRISKRKKKFREKKNQQNERIIINEWKQWLAMTA